MGLANECENVILEVGFGPGNLRRSHHMSINEGAPYVLAGRQHDDFGNPLYDSRNASSFSIIQKVHFSSTYTLTGLVWP